MNARGKRRVFRVLSKPCGPPAVPNCTRSVVALLRASLVCHPIILQMSLQRPEAACMRMQSNGALKTPASGEAAASPASSPMPPAAAAAAPAPGANAASSPVVRAGSSFTTPPGDALPWAKGLRVAPNQDAPGAPRDVLGGLGAAPDAAPEQPGKVAAFAQALEKRTRTESEKREAARKPATREVCAGRSSTRPAQH